MLDVIEQFSYISVFFIGFYMEIMLLYWSGGIPPEEDEDPVCIRAGTQPDMLSQSLLFFRKSICGLVCRHYCVIFVLLKHLLSVFTHCPAGFKIKPWKQVLLSLPFRPNNSIFSKHTRDTLRAFGRAFNEEEFIITTGERPISTNLFLWDARGGHGVAGETRGVEVKVSKR